MIEQLPNQHELIPNLATLDRLIMENVSTDAYSSIQRETEQLPYYLRGACFSINELERFRIETIDAWKNIPSVGPDTQYILSPENFDPLSFSVDSYLFFIRRVMDSLISYLNRCPENLSLPSSMNDLIKKMIAGKVSLDSVIHESLTEYWNTCGEKVKGYRDQVNHKAVILSNCIVFNTPKGFGLKMLLPDDPHEKSPSKINYKPGVGAMGFIMESLKLTIQLVNRIVERLIDIMGAYEDNPREKGIVGPAIRGGTLSITKLKSGEPIPYPIGVKHVLQMAMSE